MLGLNSEQRTTLMKNKVSQQPTKRGFPCITLIFLTFKTLKHMLPKKENIKCQFPFSTISQLPGQFLP